MQEDTDDHNNRKTPDPLAVLPLLLYAEFGPPVIWRWGMAGCHGGGESGSCLGWCGHLGGWLAVMLFRKM